MQCSLQIDCTYLMTLYPTGLCYHRNKFRLVIVIVFDNRFMFSRVINLKKALPGEVGMKLKLRLTLEMFAGKT